MTSAQHAAEAVVSFWRDAGVAAWFRRDDAFDLRFRNGFLETHFAAARRELDEWADSAEGSLALLILLDQFPRNVFRGTAHAFATDPLARHFAEHAVAAGHDVATDGALRIFRYMPFEHSETLADQQRALVLIEPLGAEYQRYARIHHDVIARFGRFPHRNAALGRATTSEEQSFLDTGGFAA